MIYFAYGPDLDPARITERSPSYRSLGVARLADHWITFSRYSPSDRSGVISLEESRGSIVWGVLYDIPDEDVPILDYHFGFDPDRRADMNDHIAGEVSVLQVGHSQPVVAMTYIAVADNRQSLPSAAYMALIVDGARYHGLPRAYIAALQAIRTDP